MSDTLSFGEATKKVKDEIIEGTGISAKTFEIRNPQEYCRSGAALRVKWLTSRNFGVAKSGRYKNVASAIKGFNKNHKDYYFSAGPIRFFKMLMTTPRVAISGRTRDVDYFADIEKLKSLDKDLIFIFGEGYSNLLYYSHKVDNIQFVYNELKLMEFKCPICGCPAVTTDLITEIECNKCTACQNVRRLSALGYRDVAKFEPHRQAFGEAARKNEPVFDFTTTATSTRTHYYTDSTDTTSGWL